MFPKGRCSLSLFLSLPHLGAPSCDTQSPQLHLDRRQGGCLHVCKTRALFHTLLTSLSKGGSGVGHAGMVPFLASLKMLQHTHSKLQGDEGCDIAARGSSCRRSLWQRKRGPARAGSPCYSAAKESEQVMSLQSPLCATSLEHQFFTAKTVPPAQS